MNAKANYYPLSIEVAEYLEKQRRKRLDGSALLLPSFTVRGSVADPRFQHLNKLLLKYNLIPQA